MSGSHRWRTLLLCIALEVGALAGVPMRPEQIEELMQTLAKPKVAHTIPDVNEKGDGGTPD